MAMAGFGVRVGVGACAGAWVEAQVGARAGEDDEATEVVTELGSLPSGKLSFARNPLNFVAAWSYAIAASSAVSNVPNQTRAAFFGSRISAAHFPHGRWRTPRYLRFFTGGAGGTGAAAIAASGVRSLMPACPPIPSPVYPPPPSTCSPNPLRRRI